jgi:hypothetical protein
MEKEGYIGDGVYWQFDGFGITLFTIRAGNEKHWIYLEPREIETLLKVIEVIADERIKQIDAK